MVRFAEVPAIGEFAEVLAEERLRNGRTARISRSGSLGRQFVVFTM